MNYNFLQTYAHKVSQKNRLKKYKLFIDSFNPNKTTKILDVGFASEEGVYTTNYFEKNYPHQKNITTLSITEISQEVKEKYPEINFVIYDGNKFPFENKSFDICFSNDVLEHVGNEDKQSFFLSEIKRVSKKSFITTPNKYFPIETHTLIPFLHFLLPKFIFDILLILINKKDLTKDNLRLLSKKDLYKLLNRNQYENFKIIENKFLLFTLDFVVISENN